MVARNCHTFTTSRRDKTFQPVTFCFLAYFFGPTAFALACHCFANAGFQSPDAPFCTILDEYASQDGWHLSCYGLHVGDVPANYLQHESVRCDRGHRIREHMRVMTGHAQEGVPKQTVAGRVPSIVQSTLIKNVPKEVSGDIWHCHGHPTCDRTITRKAMAH